MTGKYTKPVLISTITDRGYYTAARRYDFYEFYLQVVKTIFTNERSE
jgi:hypothetical protein